MSAILKGKINSLWVNLTLNIRKKWKVCSTIKLNHNFGAYITRMLNLRFSTRTNGNYMNNTTMISKCKCPLDLSYFSVIFRTMNCSITNRSPGKIFILLLCIMLQEFKYYTVFKNKCFILYYISYSYFYEVIKILDWYWNKNFIDNSNWQLRFKEKGCYS